MGHFHCLLTPCLKVTPRLGCCWWLLLVIFQLDDCCHTMLRLQLQCWWRSSRATGLLCSCQRMLLASCLWLYWLISGPGYGHTVGAHENTDPNYRKDVLQMSDTLTWPLHTGGPPQPGGSARPAGAGAAWQGLQPAGLLGCWPGSLRSMSQSPAPAGAEHGLPHSLPATVSHLTLADITKTDAHCPTLSTAHSTAIPARIRVHQYNVCKSVKTMLQSNGLQLNTCLETFQIQDRLTISAHSLNTVFTRTYLGN